MSHEDQQRSSSVFMALTYTLEKAVNTEVFNRKTIFSFNSCKLCDRQMRQLLSFLKTIFNNKWNGLEPSERFLKSEIVLAKKNSPFLLMFKFLFSTNVQRKVFFR